VERPTHSYRGGVSTTLYDQLGGQSFFERLVERFYEGVESDDLLRAMYPDDLSESKRHLTLFLVQYWGGPATYSHERGHPRLRLRHARFSITMEARDAWMAAMDAALTGLREELTDEQFEELHSYFAVAATQMRNV
jgi:hemoglobin